MTLMVMIWEWTTLICLNLEQSYRGVHSLSILFLSHQLSLLFLCKVHSSGHCSYFPKQLWKELWRFFTSLFSPGEPLSAVQVAPLKEVGPAHWLEEKEIELIDGSLLDSFFLRPMPLVITIFVIKNNDEPVTKSGWIWMKKIKINPESEYNGDNHRARVNQNTFVCFYPVKCFHAHCPITTLCSGEWGTLPSLSEC